MELIPHPDWPAHTVRGIEVDAAVRGGIASLAYHVRGAVPAMAPPAAPERTDDLWKHTCFELFVRPAGGEGYYEFNFAPSGQWAAYRFERYRAGRNDAPLATPVIEVTDEGVQVTVDLSGLPKGEWRVGLSAVIEEADLTMSYWALAHAAGKADFHDPAGWALTIR